jgi:hypothetical protein
MIYKHQADKQLSSKLNSVANSLHSPAVQTVVCTQSRTIPHCVQNDKHCLTSQILNDTVNNGYPPVRPSKSINHFLMNALLIHLRKTPLEASGFQTANGASYVYPLT